MSVTAYRIEECDRIFDENGKDMAVDIDHRNRVVRISRRGNVLAIARAMLALGMELGNEGITLLPIVGAID